jgi:putative protein-disulfide isomerase
MEKPVLIYCFDAYCGWCYGFSGAIKKVATNYADKLSFEVLSGGMIVGEKTPHIGATAGYIAQAYKQVEEYSGVTFGDDYLWHIKNPDQSDWFPDSEVPARALCILKEMVPAATVFLASDIQHALYLEGRDLTDPEAYNLILEKYGIDKAVFLEKLNSAEYSEKARQEFALCRQLQVTGFPCVFIQANDGKFYMVARGYTSYEDLTARIDAVLEQSA